MKLDRNSLLTAAAIVLVLYLVSLVIGLPGWSAVYGFGSCVLLIFVSKFLGHQGGLMRREDYYD